jgi:hypothetical protein
VIYSSDASGSRLSKAGDICSIAGLIIAIPFAIVTGSVWIKSGIVAMNWGIFWLSSITLLMLVAAALQVLAVKARRRLLPDNAEQNAPPAQFEPSAHLEEDFPITRKNAVYAENPGINYPSKVYIEAMNNTVECTEISISRWLSGIKAEVLTGVLQIWLGYGWFPKPDGLATLHVPPGERFRLWIAPSKQYSRDEL